MGKERRGATVPIDAGEEGAGGREGGRGEGAVQKHVRKTMEKQGKVANRRQRRDDARVVVLFEVVFRVRPDSS